jgi:hypothetical protein
VKGGKSSLVVDVSPIKTADEVMVLMKFGQFCAKSMGSCPDFIRNASILPENG